MSEITVDMIQRSAMSFTEYQMGRTLYFNRAAEITQQESFWRGESQVRGKVTEAGKSYFVHVEMADDRIKEFSCTCSRHTGRKLCRHLVAAMLLWSKGTSGAAKTIKSSVSGTRIMDAYAVRNYNRAMAMGSGEIHLEPILFLERGRVSLECRIGKEKLYIIQDLQAFAVAVHNRESVSYGKNTWIVHDRGLFDDWSASLCDLITGAVWTESQVSAQNDYRQSRKIRKLSLSPVLIDQLMELMTGRHLRLEEVMNEDRKHAYMDEINHGFLDGNRTWEVVESDPEIFLMISRKGRDGIHFELPATLSVFLGEKRIYICLEGKIYCCSIEFSEEAGVFLNLALNHTYPAYGQFDLNEKDMPRFCQQVLSRIQKHLCIKEADVETASYCPDQLETRFYLDQDSSGMITCRIEHQYGNWIFNPLTVHQEGVQEEKNRDEAEELLIHNILSRYFFRNADGKTLITPNEESVFLFLTEGIEALNGVGQVYATDAVSAMESMKPGQARVGVSLEGNLLSLEIDMEGIDREELFAVLDSYRQKKKYHRLKNGDFLNLTEGGLDAVADLAAGLGLEKRELEQKRIPIPAYRAMYIDRVMQEDSSLVSFRDQAFENMVAGMQRIKDHPIEIPAQICDTLRGYQKEGYQWLKTLEQYGFSGILADDMGLGKTIQVITLLLSQPADRFPSLIVCPSSLIYNWEHEFSKFAPGMRVLPVMGTAEERKALLPHLQEYDAVITSYDLLRRDEAMYQDSTFQYMILDEAQYIKNHTTQNAKTVKTIKALHKVALTGTPIENRLSELWSIFDFLMPGFLYSYTRFRSEYEQAIVREQDAEAVKRFRRLTEPFILRRLKQDVLQDLPEKTEQVIFTRLTGVQKQLYQASVLQLKEQLTAQSGEEYKKNQLKILAQLMRMRQICCDPSLCFEEYHGGSAKLDTCMELITDSIASGHKLLLFSQFTSMLGLIEKELIKADILYYKLTGNVSKEERQQMVNEFQQNTVPVFLISLKAGGTGLNLTAADIVIHYDPWWNVAAQDQATDRTHRIGQENPVTVYKLIAQNTIEEQILKLQEKKKDLSDQILSGHGESLSHLSREELIEILS